LEGQPHSFFLHSIFPSVTDILQVYAAAVEV